MCVSMTTFSRRGFVSRDIVQFNIKQSRYSNNRNETLTNNALSRCCPTSSCVVDVSRVLSKKFSSTRTPISSDTVIEALTKQQAKELTSKLSSEERKLFLAALNESKSEETKADYKGQLAAFRWRSKLGRPSKIPSLGEVDPTGTYCPMPDDWLNRKYVENVPEPTTKDLVLVAIANAIPFVGFGFLDNFIMIIAGDQIELVLNRRFPISTMAAAALGNTVSDVIGIGSVHYVEIFAQKVGFKAPTLTLGQLNLPRTRIAANL
ncbi:transmembrane protein 65, partial [Lasius niger]